MIAGYVPIIGSGKNIVHPIYVDDVAEVRRMACFLPCQRGHLLLVLRPSAHVRMTTPTMDKSSSSTAQKPGRSLM